jgi:hypothetical protein
MKNTFFALISLLLLASSFTLPVSDDQLSGIWVRKTDQLRISVSGDVSDRLSSFIIDEGRDEFPCKVSHLPIYRNIQHVRGTLWTCEFLVVTMGSCSTDYEEGIIRLTDKGEMEITCPGFEKKIYTRIKPRYDND